MIASLRKTERTNVMTTLTQTFTQSGLLAVLLERQHSRKIGLAWRRAQRKQLRAAFGMHSVGQSTRSRHECSSTIPVSTPSRARVEPFTKGKSPCLP